MRKGLNCDAKRSNLRLKLSSVSFHRFLITLSIRRNWDISKVDIPMGHAVVLIYLHHWRSLDHFWSTTITFSLLKPERSLPFVRKWGATTYLSGATGGRMLQWCVVSSGMAYFVRHFWPCQMVPWIGSILWHDSFIVVGHWSSWINGCHLLMMWKLQGGYFCDITRAVDLLINDEDLFDFSGSRFASQVGVGHVHLTVVSTFSRALSEFVVLSGNSVRRWMSLILVGHWSILDQQHSYPHFEELHDV